ncbi:hypothetical protein Q0F98_33610 [Paenibacillus amylolyticus]|nr:hypothetical protein Q0F98_33610 [Paenibacillus amylolyticus]
MMYKHGQQVWGSVDISKGVTITANNNTFTFHVDDSSYTITIPVGTYKTSQQRHESELIQAISEGRGGSEHSCTIYFGRNAL